MKTQLFPIHEVLPISILPLAGAGVSHLLYMLGSYLPLLANTSTENQNEDGSPTNFQQDSSQNGAVTFISSQTGVILHQFKTFTMSVYANLVTFLVVMMILHIGVYHLREIRARKNQASPRQQRSPATSGISAFQHFIGLILCYTLSFYLIKFSLALLLPTSPTSSSIQLQTTVFSESNHSFRKLEEEDDNSNRMLVAQKPAFYRIINGVEVEDLFVLDIVFTRDFETAFELDIDKSLVVYNISDHNAPKKIGSLKNVLPDSDQDPFELLSPKGRLLFIHQTSIQLINVTNPQNPALISQIQFKAEKDHESPQFHARPSLAISSDERYLLCSNSTFHIYDISDPNMPQLLFVDDSWESTTVILSADDRIAFIGSQDALKIFDITNFRALQLLSSLPVNGKVLTCALSVDQGTLYIIFYVPNQANTGFMQTLCVVNVANITNPIKEHIISLEPINDILATSLTISPDQAFLMLQSRIRLTILNLRDFKPLSFPIDFWNFQHTVFLPNGKNALLFTTNLFEFLEAYLNVPYDQASSLQPNYVAQRPLHYLPERVILHPSGERAFILAKDEGSQQKRLLDIDIKNNSKPNLAASFDLMLTPDFSILSSNGDSIYYKSQENILQVLRTEDEGGFSTFKSVQFEDDFEEVFAISSDQSTLFALSRISSGTDVFYSILIYNVSDSSPQLLSTLSLQQSFSQFDFKSESISMRLSSDEQTLFFLNIYFYIIDVSNLETPTIQSQIELTGIFTQTFVHSSDYKTFFVLGFSVFQNTRKVLLTVDTTDFNNPRILKRASMPFNTKYWLSISSDDQLLFFGTSETFLTFNISNRTELKISKYQTLKVSTFIPLQNTQNILICNQHGLQIINPKPKLALYTSQYQFKLGEVSSNPLKVLELNNYNNYASFQQNYKFIQASLCTPTIKPLQNFSFTFPAFPSWMDFDKENALLNLDLRLPSKIANYEIYSRVSTQVSNNDFLAIKEANYTKDETENLQNYLIGQGYLDPEKYLTSIFDANMPLALDDQYSKFEGKIREKLKSHLIEMLTTISIESSLSLEQTKSLRIVTASKNSISVTIKLIPEQAKFVPQKFSDVKDHLGGHRASLVLEGTLQNINDALERLFINVEKDGHPCEGNITISDGLNPELIEHFDNIAIFFNINGQPKMQEKHSIQSQIDQSPVIIAGQHFNIEFHESTFIDPNERPLTYSLEVTNNKTELLPSWIALRGRSLSGTPPEAFLPYTQTLVLRASNEYKSKAIVFTLRIRLSWMTIASRWLVIIGYFWTTFKTWQHSDKVYNILCKKYYTYPVTLKIVPGHEVSRDLIFPIALITEEVRDLSNIILTAIKQDLGRESPLTDKQLIEYLTDIRSGDLNKQRLSEMIQDIVVQQSKARISQYYKGKGFNKNSVLQLIVNKLTMERIKLPQEKVTLAIFEKIKSKWIDLVDMNPDSDGFIINDDNLADVLRIRKMSLALSAKQGNTTHEYSLDEKIIDDDTESLSKKIPTKKSIEKELVISPSSGSGSKINIGLLKDAILAHAFNCQNLFTSKHDINIQSNEKTETKSFIKKFIKFDLKSLVVHSTKRLGYGLKYGIIRNQIVFYGKFQEQFENKTMVIQIVSKGGFILRELSIHGHINDVRSESIFIESVQDVL